MNPIKKLIKEPDTALKKIWKSMSPRIKSDRIFLSVLYFLGHGKRMNWNNPQTFNEKTNWLKLWSKDRAFERYVDKYEVRKYVAEKIGEEYLVPLLGVWERVEDIDFSSLPQRYVLKTTHDSGGVVIVREGIKPLQIALLRRHLNRNFFWTGREYPYKTIQPRIIAEEYMEDESGRELKDYKLFCFNGKPEILFIASDRFNEKGERAYFDYFDMSLNRLPFGSRHHNHNPVWEHSKPSIPNFELMKRLAAKLAEGFPFIRIDFYNVKGRIVFGEMTFFHDNAEVPFTPWAWNRRLGDMVILPKK